MAYAASTDVPVERSRAELAPVEGPLCTVISLADLAALGEAA